MVGGKNLIGFYHKVVVGIALEACVVHCKCVVGGVGSVVDGYFERILKGYGVEECFEIMVTVGTLRYNVEA